MSTVKIYRVECTKWFTVDEHGYGYSLQPWGSNTEIYEGDDDGGRDYILPEGFKVAESNSGSLEIYDEKGEHVTLIGNKAGRPALVCLDERQIWLKDGK